MRRSLCLFVLLLVASQCFANPVSPYAGFRFTSPSGNSWTTWVLPNNAPPDSWSTGWPTYYDVPAVSENIFGDKTERNLGMLVFWPSLYFDGYDLFGPLLYTSAPDGQVSFLIGSFEVEDEFYYDAGTITIYPAPEASSFAMLVGMLVAAGLWRKGGDRSKLLR